MEESWQWAHMPLKGPFFSKSRRFPLTWPLFLSQGPWFKVSSKHRKQSTQCSRTSDSQHPNINVGHTCPNSLPCLSLRLSFQPGAKQSLMDIYSGDGNLLQPSLRHDLVSSVLPLKDLGHKIVLAGWGFPVSFSNPYFRSLVTDEALHKTSLHNSTSTT